jgi:hypothetical protein
LWSADGGCEKPDVCDKANADGDEALCRDLEEADRLAEEYWRDEMKREAELRGRVR